MVLTKTGVIRHIDDLGRVVIPKEIRRTLKLKENDPLEIFTTDDGMVCFRKYCPYVQADWEKMKGILLPIVPTGFALLDSFGDVKAFSKVCVRRTLEEAMKSNDVRVSEIRCENGDLIAYLVTGLDCDPTRLDMAIAVLKAFVADAM